ncbi:MAG: alpha/beta hydrolase, partial [Okeania sp. SIO3H1]|nr:alpha/beta hydrolase [Okeania sp. SIO3H1]
SERVLIHSHGNAEDIGYLVPLMEQYRDLGFTVVAYDYPGYGHSSGTPSIQGTEQALLAMIDAVTEQFDVTYDQIILFGRSVGSGPSVYAATQIPVGGLILESPLTSIFQVQVPHIQLPFDSFPNWKRIRNVTCPVLIIHGQKDKVISPLHGRRLHASAPNPLSPVWLEHSGHNDVMFTSDNRYWDRIRMFPKTPTERLEDGLPSPTTL